MNLWFQKYNTQYRNELEGDGDAGGSSEGVSDASASSEAEASTSAVASESFGDTGSSDPWGNFDLDSYLSYDPMKKEPEPEPEPTPEPQQAPVPAPTASAPASTPNPDPAPAALDPKDLELAVLREQLQNMQSMVQGQQQNQGQQALQAQAPVPDTDPELEPFYQVPQSYSQMQIPPALLDDLMSGEPVKVASSLNQFAQGLAQIVHSQVAEQAKAREALIAKRAEEKATAPYRQQQVQEQSRKLHDDFYGRHKELDKPEWKPYIAMRMKQYAKQLGVETPSQQFLDWGAYHLKKELVATAMPVVPPASAQPAAKPPFMAGQGGGRASSPGAQTPQDDIFDTLMT